MRFNPTAALVSVLWITGVMPITQALAQGPKTVHNGHVVDGMVVIEGDIFIGRASGNSSLAAEPLNRGLGLSGSLSLWQNGIVPYAIDAGVSALGREIILAAVAHWNDNSSITLVDRDTAADSAPDYIRFITGPGCASWVGRQNSGAQEIWVSDYCTSGSMIHEVGHALGLLHEHTRSDRDQYIDVRWDNIQSDKLFNFEISGSGTVDLGPYDYGSIMHYGEYFFSNNGERTLVPIQNQGDVVIGQRVAASDGDLNAINRLYETDLALSVEKTIAEDNSELQLTVTNQGQNGAHAVVVSVSGAGSITDFSTVDDWQCNLENAEVQCHLAQLSAGATSKVTLIVTGDVSAAALSLLLRSKTYDNDLSNNQGGEPEIGGATTPTFDSDRTPLSSGAAAGALDGWTLLLLISALWRFGVLRRSPRQLLQLPSVTGSNSSVTGVRSWPANWPKVSGICVMVTHRALLSSAVKVKRSAHG